MTDKALSSLTQGTPDTGDFTYGALSGNSRKVQIGSFQPRNTNLNDLGALTPTSNRFIFGDTGSWISDTGSAVRRRLALDTGDSPAFTNITQTGYTDLAEIPEPSSPAANVARLFARDVSSRTEFAFKNSSGQVIDLLRGFVSVKDYGAVGDAIEVAGCSITSSDTTLTAPASTFVASDVGKQIAILGAGAAGVPLRTTIASFTDTDEVELTDAASTTAASTTICFGTDDTTAIQAALAASHYVAFPPGSYISTAKIVLTSNRNLAGLGRVILYSFISSTSAIAITDLTTLTTGNRVLNIGIENIIIDGFGSSGSIGTDLTQVSSALLRNVIAVDFLTGFRVRGIAYYNRLEFCHASGCTTGFHIVNDSASQSGPNHTSLNYCRVNHGSDGTNDGILIEENGSTNINDVSIIHPAIEDIAESGSAFRFVADNLLQGVSIIQPRVDVVAASIEGFTFDDIGNTDRIAIINPHLQGVTTAFSPALTDTDYTDRVTVVSPEKTNMHPRGWQVLAESSVAVSHTGDTNETAIATVAIPGGAMGANGLLRITMLWTVTNNANNKVWRVRLGGVAGTQLRGVTETTNLSTRESFTIGNRNSESSQLGGPPNTSLVGGWGRTTGSFLTGTVNTANDQDLVFTAQLADSGDTITLESYIVELLARA